MKKFLNVAKNMDGYIVAFFLIAMSLSSFFQVLNRNIFKLPISWTEEVSRYSMIWMTMIGTALGVRKGMQMSVVLFGKHVKGMLLKALTVFKNLMMTALSGIVAIMSVKLMSTQARAGQVSTALKIPLQFVSLGIFVGMILILIFQVLESIKCIRVPAGEYHPVTDKGPTDVDANEEIAESGGPYGE